MGLKNTIIFAPSRHVPMASALFIVHLCFYVFAQNYLLIFSIHYMYNVWLAIILVITKVIFTHETKIIINHIMIVIDIVQPSSSKVSKRFASSP